MRHVLLLQTCLTSSQTKIELTVTFLEEWAARLLKPDISDIQKDAKADSNTKKRFQHAKTPTNFELTDMDYTVTGNADCDKKTHLQQLA